MSATVPNRRNHYPLSSAWGCIIHTLPFRVAVKTATSTLRVFLQVVYVFQLKRICITSSYYDPTSNALMLYDYPLISEEMFFFLGVYNII